MESEMEAQKVNPGKELDFFTYADGVALVYDRRRSVLARFGRDEHRKAREQGSAVPFHDAKYDEFSEVVMEHGFRGHSVYLWTRRVGDCIEIDLEDIQSKADIIGIDDWVVIAGQAGTVNLSLVSDCWRLCLRV
ncbi:hypothetical protein B0H16DRAFT_1712016 [Mycena metata]|uniref:Uncharacterized protein n=1 Tax=Mycena metata TaxID=1033252 RepID=A0AAD7K4Y7_9AGAR|nr:hypothetical protein B0H16DRAFT_1712016 [Mycena metata]